MEITQRTSPFSTSLLVLLMESEGLLPGLVAEITELEGKKTQHEDARRDTAFSTAKPYWLDRNNNNTEREKGEKNGAVERA